MKTLLWPERPKDKGFHHPTEGREQPHSLWSPKQKEDLSRPSRDLALLPDQSFSSSTTPTWAIYINNSQYLSVQWFSIPKPSSLPRRRNLTCKTAFPGNPRLLASSSDVTVVYLFLRTPPACSSMLPYFRENWLFSTFRKQNLVLFCFHSLWQLGPYCHWSDSKRLCFPWFPSSLSPRTTVARS